MDHHLGSSRRQLRVVTLEELVVVSGGKGVTSAMNGGAHGRGSARQMLAGVFVVLSTAAVTGCSTHPVALIQPCSTAPKQATIVVASDRGAIGLMKVGLTPAELTAEQSCR
jgi:hypothetical protein